ncbi:hypothetical protein QCA50_012831 [Cerrena zonata]|uniref:PIN domain-containing protein n=1 Tax=Cerrena zonata TaxID=2478898 RepID=A0AAW0FZA8_9APHY
MPPKQLVDEDDRQNHHLDELVDYSKSFQTNASIDEKAENDHSAFVRGIGNVKRWFNQQYVESNYKSFTKNEKVYLNIFIPSYTLHEFDFAKKGTSMMATNAREAIRFIDRVFESDINAEDDGHNFKNPIVYNLTIETINNSYPSWNECLKYKIHNPKVKEFPNFKTKFDSNLIGQHSEVNNNPYDELSENFGSTLSFKNTKLNDIQYENSQSYQDAIARSEDEAEMPVRLRLYDPRYNFNSDYDHLNDDPESGILHNTIDTTQYSYTTMKKEKSLPPGKGRKSKDHWSKAKGKGKNRYDRPSTKIEGVVSTGDTSYGGEYVKKEKFDAINYAPRGSGKLWKPS